MLWGCTVSATRSCAIIVFCRTIIEEENLSIEITKFRLHTDTLKIANFWSLGCKASAVKKIIYNNDYDKDIAIF